MAEEKTGEFHPENLGHIWDTKSKPEMAHKNSCDRFPLILQAEINTKNGSTKIQVQFSLKFLKVVLKASGSS